MNIADVGIGPPPVSPWKPWTRCRARREPRPVWFPTLRVFGARADDHGRCRLRRHGPHVDHEIRGRRGTVRWSTAPTNAPNPPVPCNGPDVDAPGAWWHPHELAEWTVAVGGDPAYAAGIVDDAAAQGRRSTTTPNTREGSHGPRHHHRHGTARR